MDILQQDTDIINEWPLRSFWPCYTPCFFDVLGIVLKRDENYAYYYHQMSYVETVTDMLMRHMCVTYSTLNTRLNLNGYL